MADRVLRRRLDVWVRGKVVVSIKQAGGTNCLHLRFFLYRVNLTPFCLPSVNVMQQRVDTGCGNIGISCQITAGTEFCGGVPVFFPS